MIVEVWWFWIPLNFNCFILILLLTMVSVFLLAFYSSWLITSHLKIYFRCGKRKDGKEGVCAFRRH